MKQTYFPLNLNQAITLQTFSFIFQYATDNGTLIFDKNELILILEFVHALDQKKGTNVIRLSSIEIMRATMTTTNVTLAFGSLQVALVF